MKVKHLLLFHSLIKIAAANEFTSFDIHSQNETVAIESKKVANLDILLSPFKAVALIIKTAGESALEGMRDVSQLGIVTDQPDEKVQLVEKKSTHINQTEHHKEVKNITFPVYDEATEGGIFLDKTFGAIQDRVGDVARVVRIAGDTVAGLAGGSIKGLGAAVQGAAAVLDSTSKTLNTKEKEKAMPLPSWLTEEGVTLEECKAEEGKSNNPILRLKNLGQNTLADVFKVGGITVRGLGDAVFQVGAVAESMTSGTGQVAEDVVRVFEGILGSARLAIDLSGDISSPLSPLINEKLDSQLGNKIFEDILGSTKEERPPADSKNFFQKTFGFFCSIGNFIFWLFKSCALHLKILLIGDERTGSGFVPPLGPLLGLGLASVIYIYRRPWTKCRRLFFGAILWLILASVEHQHRRRLMWAGEAAAFNHLQLILAAGGETATWLNSFVHMIWTVPGECKDCNGLGLYTSRMIGKEAYAALQETAPTSVAQIEISKFYLGSTPPLLKGLTLIGPEEAPGPAIPNKPIFHIKLDIDIDSTDMDVVVLVKMSRLKHAKLPQGTIKLTGLKLRAQLLMSIEIEPKYPFVGLAFASFDSVPNVDIILGNSNIDVMSLGTADLWLRLAMTTALKSYVKPNYMIIDLAQ